VTIPGDEATEIYNTKFLMKFNKRLIGILVIVVIVSGAALAYRQWIANDPASSRDEMLSMLPHDPSAVVYVDLPAFRSSAFLSQLLAWAPQLPTDAEYAQFVQATGFNYERDLDRVTMAFSRQPAGGFVYGIADGRFDRKKIEEYAGQKGERINGKVAGKSAAVFSLPLKNSARASFFTFLRGDRIAWTNDPDYANFFGASGGTSRSAEWKEYFSRLAGSPLFAVIRQDSLSAAVLAQQTPGGFRSPQLASLLNQLEWVTVGAKPDGSILRVVLEGESASETATHQLKDFIGGILLLAQAGLNGPKNRKELDPRLREAYLELLKSANVEEVTRGTEKSVRVVFEVTPEFLKAASANSTPTLH